MIKHTLGNDDDTQPCTTFALPPRHAPAQGGRSVYSDTLLPDGRRRLAAEPGWRGYNASLRIIDEPDAFRVAVSDVDAQIAATLARLHAGELDEAALARVEAGLREVARPTLRQWLRSLWWRAGAAWQGAKAGWRGEL